MRANRFKVIAASLAVLIFPALAMAQGNVGVDGTVKQSGTDTPVSFATIVAMDADSTVAGATVAGEDGRYSLRLAAGDYIFDVSCIGYEEYTYTATIHSETTQLDFSLKLSTTTIDEVKVRAPKIRREADRFVMNVAGTMDAIGKNAEDFLKTAPAVWIKDDKILVDGRSGAQIMVDDRILNMDDEQAIAYLRGINAEDIARVEIIPRSGADYDASASGGVIKITLRKKRDSGLEISPSYRMQLGKEHYVYRPGITVNYRTGRFAFYTNAYNGHNTNRVDLTEINTSGSTVTSSEATLKSRSHYGGGRFGVIYDVNDKQSVGVEYSLYVDNGYSRNNPYTVITSGGIVSTDSSRYRQVSKPRNHYVAANYILRLDSLGSVFKIIGDVARTNTSGDNNFWNRHNYFQGPNAGSYRDTLYRNDLTDKYIVATGTASLEKALPAGSRLQAGLKFVYTSLDDDSRYYGNTSADNWMLNTDYSVKQRYTEKIGAAYAVYSSGFGPVKYTLGLRGEYTHATPVTSLFKDTATQKNRNTYFSLFPNANVSVTVQEKKGHSVSAFYARKINRPGYWALNPFRMQVSEYSYIIGDPMLKPAYIDETGIAFTLFHKLSFSAGHRWTKDRVEQYVTTDEVNPNIIVYQQMNLATNKDAFVSVNLPVDLTEKISMNSNIYYVHQKMDPGTGGNRINFNNLSVNATLNFTLPRTYRIEATGWYTNGQRWGNMLVKGMGDINLAVRKRFLDDKLAVAVEVKNIMQFRTHQKFTIVEENFTRNMVQKQTWDRRSVMMSLQYNFKTGKKANGRQVERGGDDSR